MTNKKKRANKKPKRFHSFTTKIRAAKKDDYSKIDAREEKRSPIYDDEDDIREMFNDPPPKD